MMSEIPKAPRICACGNMIKLKSKVDKCTACIEGRSRYVREEESEADAPHQLSLVRASPMTRPMTETCPKLREAIENGHLRCSVSVGVGSPVATIDTEDLWRLVHAAERSLSTSAAERRMREALKAALPMIADHAAGGRRYTKPADASRVFAMMRAALSVEGEDEQARGQGRSAPISTGTKDTTK